MRFFVIFEFMLRRKTLQLILNIFPPLFFNRIILKEISEDYSHMKVKLRRSILNINFHKTIFGGTIFSAFDPYLPTMYYNIFHQKNRKLEVWLKSAKINYLKPADSHLILEFRINKKDIELAEKELNSKGKIEIWHCIKAINKNGIVCAESEILVFLRDKK